MSAPPFTYFGGKTAVAQQIVDLLPPHVHYVEPYAGSLAVLLAKPVSPLETVNDLDGDLMCFWRVLRDHPEELIRRCALSPHSRAEAANAVRARDDIERAREVWVTLTQSRARTMRRTGWRHFVKPGGPGMPDRLAAYVDRMAAAAERLQHVSLECRPGPELIETYGAHEEVLLYVDPPYVGSTRNGQNYAIEAASEGEHVELARALRRSRARVVLSGYDSELYEDLYAGWHRTEIQTATGNGSAGARARTEVLWSNEPLGRQSPLWGPDALTRPQVRSALDHNGWSPASAAGICSACEEPFDVGARVTSGPGGARAECCATGVEIGEAS